MSTDTFPRRAIHLDFHTMPGIYDIAREFDADSFTKTLSDAHVDYITAFAKCNLGFSYYPSEIGTVYPGLEVDLLGEMVEACHARDIRVAAYFNAGIDHEHARTHREWCKVDKEGRVYNREEMGHFFRDLCLNTGYGDHLLAMVREVLERYPVDGVFLDCFDLKPCYGHECIDAMRAAGMDVFDDDAVTAYAAEMTDTFLNRAEDLVREVRDGIFVYFNSSIPLRRQPTHIELEVLPTGGWGYEYLPFAIRYARTLGKPYFTMTGRFHKSWGDFGGLRTKHSLLYDCYTSIANGGTCSVGDHMHPRGRLEPEVYRLIGDVYADVRALEPWTAGTRSVADTVVVEPRLQYWPSYRIPMVGAGEFSLDAVKGAARMLGELGCQFDISDGLGDLTGYDVVILPDTAPVDDALKAKLQAHLDRGGAVIGSARAGLNVDGTGFALDAYGAGYEGAEPCSPTFFEALPAVSDDIPDMPVAVYQQGIAMRSGEGAEVLARVVKPYANLREWDYAHEVMYAPPEKTVDRPAVVRNGRVIHFSFPLFAGYLRDAVVAHRTLFRNCLRLVQPDPLVRVANLPSFGRVTVTAKDDVRLVHLLAYVPELRGEAEMIEEPIVAENVEMALRVSGDVNDVRLAPGDKSIPFAQDGDYVRFTAPRVTGYQLVVVA